MPDRALRDLVLERLDKDTRPEDAWSALVSFRPFLSYNELGSMLDDGPSKLYDALSKVLGLDALVDAQEALQKARHALLDLLQRLSVLQPPDEAKVKEAVRALREAEARQARAAQTVAGKSDDLASLLDHALRFHQAHGDGDCPVCGSKGALDKAWHEAKAKEAESLRQAAREASEARKALEARTNEARKLVEIDTALLRKAEAAGLQDLANEAVAAAQRARGPVVETQASALAQSIEKEIGHLASSVDQLRKKAQQQLDSRQDAWRPHARDLAEWLPRARKAKEDAQALPALKAAEKCMKDAADAIRNERFAPIAERTRATPRATLPESPFRFVVIDDPVQSMDDRLPEAVRRLGIRATQIEVIRREGSVVVSRQASDPVSRYISDALTLAKTGDLPQEVAKRVVPGLYRQAVEAKSLAALALFDDESRAGDVLRRLNKESKASADTFRAVNEGAHGTLHAPVLDVVRSSEKLARWRQALP